MTIANITQGRINLTGNSPKVTTGNISYSNSSVLTNVMNLDPFFNGLDVTGDINISMQAEDFPTISFNLITNSATIASQIQTRFTNYQTKHVIYGMPFRVSSCNIIEQPLPQQRFEISIQMEGWNKYLVEKNVILTFSTGQRYYKLSDIANKVNVSITNIGKGISTNGQLRVDTTLKSAIDTLCNDLGLVVDYTGNTITLIKHGTSGKFTINGNKILNLQSTYNQSNVEGFVYPPTYLEWNKKTETDYEQEKRQLEQKPKYEQIRDKPEIIENDPDNASRQRNSNTIIRDMSLNFDNSGETKTKEINTYLGQKVSKTKVEVYGYAYISSQLTQDEKGWYGLGSQFWQLIETYTIDYIYDDVDGYYLGYEKRGRKLVRYRSESDDGEHKQYITDSTNSSSTQEQRDVALQWAKLYEFFWVPIEEDERLELVSYHTTYNDAAPTLEQMYESYQEFDQILGKYVTKYERNKTFSMPMYVSKRSMFSNCFAYTVTPKNNDETIVINDPITGLPKVIPAEPVTYEITGEQRKDIMKVDILPSNNTRKGANFLIGDGKKSKEDKYTEITTTLTSQDSSFGNSFTHVTSNTVNGRPPQGQNYPVYQKVEEKISSNTTLRNNDKIIVYSNWDESLTANNSVYFDVNTKSEALSALKVQLEKRNLFSINEFSFTTLFDLSLRPFSECAVTYNNKTYNGTIKSVNIPIKILNGTIAKCFMNVTCGQQLSNNQITLETYIDKPDPTPDLFLPIPYGVGDADEIESIYNDISQRTNYDQIPQ